MDMVDAVLEKLDEQVLEQLKCNLIRKLMTKRVFHKYRLNQQYFTVTIDGTGVYSFDHERYSGCPFRETKAGKRTYHQNVLEAKLVTGNGFSVSLASEWMTNKDGQTKQDCEYKAALRIVYKLKSPYPRLPLCILLDGLYAKSPIMKAKKSNNWEFIIVWKDKTMYTKQDEVADHRASGSVKVREKEIIHNQHDGTHSVYGYCSLGLNYKKTLLYYLKQIESYSNLNDPEKNTSKKFVFMSSIACDSTNYTELIEAKKTAMENRK